VSDILLLFLLLFLIFAFKGILQISIKYVITAEFDFSTIKCFHYLLPVGWE
jgi:hypothetical protein